MVVDMEADEVTNMVVVIVVDMEVDKVADEVADMVKISDSSLCFACGDVLILTTYLSYILHLTDTRKREMTMG